MRFNYEPILISTEFGFLRKFCMYKRNNFITLRQEFFKRHYCSCKYCSMQIGKYEKMSYDVLNNEYCWIFMCLQSFPNMLLFPMARVAHVDLED